MSIDYRLTDTPTEKFQNIWKYITRLQDSVSREDAFIIQEEKFQEAEKLISEGADINESFYDEIDYENNTALYYVLVEYYYAQTQYMNDEFLDNMIYFLFSKDIVIDKRSIKLCFRDTKLLDDLLKRANDIDIKFEYSSNPLFLEIITGFPSVKLDEFIPYEFSYVNKEEQGIYFKNYYYLPIEVVMLDYTTERGSAITTDDNRRDIIRILKRNGSPSPSLERIEIMFSLMSSKNTWQSKIDNIRKRFEESYDYWLNI